MRWVFVAERQGQKYWWAKCVIAAVSIVVLISVSLWLCEQKGKMCKMLDYLGNHSMEVYIIHAPFLILDRNVLSKLIGNVWIYSYFIHNCNYLLWSSIFVTLVAKKYHESVTLPSGLRMVYDNH